MMARAIDNQNRMWSQEEDALLDKLIANRASVPEMAKIMGRTKKAIYVRVQMHEQAKARAKQLVKAAPAPAAPAPAPLPIEREIAKVIAENGVVKTLGRGVRWTKEEDARLAELDKQGLPWEEIGKLMGRSPRAIESRLSITRVIKRNAIETEPEKVQGLSEASLDAALAKAFEDAAEDNTLRDLGIAPQVAPEPVQPLRRDPNLGLLLAFVTMAYSEGHSIIIPALGCTFDFFGVKENL